MNCGVWGRSRRGCRWVREFSPPPARPQDPSSVPRRKALGCLVSQDPNSCSPGVLPVWAPPLSSCHHWQLPDARAPPFSGAEGAVLLIEANTYCPGGQYLPFRGAGSQEPRHSGIGSPALLPTAAVPVFSYLMGLPWRRLFKDAPSIELLQRRNPLGQAPLLLSAQRGSGGERLTNWTALFRSLISNVIFSPLVYTEHLL